MLIAVQSRGTPTCADEDIKYGSIHTCNLLPPANKVRGKLMFLHVSIILFMGRGEGGTHATHAPCYARTPAMHTPCHGCPLPCTPLPCMPLTYTLPCHARLPLPCTHHPATYAPWNTCPLCCMPPATHPPLPHMPPCHACPLPCCTCPLPCMSPCQAWPLQHTPNTPPTTHAPCHTCPPTPCTTSMTCGK